MWAILRKIYMFIIVWKAPNFRSTAKKIIFSIWLESQVSKISQINKFLRGPQF